MATTKIKGHRIDNNAIEVKHLHDNFNLPEDRVDLHYPTHSNEADITLAQKNVLTQMGNADTLHYHTGGGGGPQGIYTNQERDIQLLKLSMLINSTKWGMDKSVKELFNDDTDIYYGIYAAKSPSLTNITNDNSIGGLLAPNKSYAYGIVYKTLLGKTNIINTNTITTKSGANNSVRLELSDVPPENTGVEIYRSTSNMEKVIVENENVNEWTNPFNLDMELDYSNKTSGLSCVKVSTKGFTNTNGLSIYNATNIAAKTGKTVLTSGKPFNTAITEVPFNYIIQINNYKNTTDRLDLMWHTSSPYIPIEYEIYYTTDSISADVDVATWNRFSGLSTLKNIDGVTLSTSTDGNIIDNYKISSNTRSNNSFSFSPVYGIKGIKIKVNIVPSACTLYDVRLFTEHNSSNSFIYKDFKGPQDFSDFSTLKMDIRTNDTIDNIKLGLEPYVNNLIGATAIFTQTLSTSTFSGSYTYRCRVYTGGGNRSAYDRIRFSIKPVPGQYIKVDSAFVMLDTKSVSNVFEYANADIENVIVPLTWNNGMSYYEGTPSTDIYTDYGYINFPNDSTVNSYMITFRVVVGSIYYLSFGNSTTYSLPNTVSPDSLTVTDSVGTGVNKWWQYLIVSNIQLCKSSTNYLSLNAVETQLYEKWKRHYIPIPSLKDIGKLTMFFSNLTLDQDIYIDNITLSRSRNIVTNSSAALGSLGSSNAANIRTATRTNYWQSALAPSITSPVAVGLTYASVQSINKLIIYWGDTACGKDYAIQTSIDSSATIDDEFDSPRWTTVNNLKIGEPGIANDFTGEIRENVVYGNNLYVPDVTHTFDKVECTKLRIVIFYTPSNTVARLRTLSVYTAEDTGELKLISEKFTKIYDGFSFIDDGKPTGTQSPQTINTTGSNNIFYDAKNKIVKLIDTNQYGTVYLNKISLSLFVNLILTSQYTGVVDFYISCNGGVTFESITPDKLKTLDKQSNSLIFKIVLKSSDATLNAVAFLYSL